MQEVMSTLSHRDSEIEHLNEELKASKELENVLTTRLSEGNDLLSQAKGKCLLDKA